MTKIQKINSFSFHIVAKDTKMKARVGKITTYHGIIDIPRAGTFSLQTCKLSQFVFYK